jgi:hypothetical protein
MADTDPERPEATSGECADRWGVLGARSKSRAEDDREATLSPAVVGTGEGRRLHAERLEDSRLRFRRAHVGWNLGVGSGPDALLAVSRAASVVMKQDMCVEDCGVARPSQAPCQVSPTLGMLAMGLIVVQ